MTREAPPYPPAAGPLAVYSKKQFHEYLDFAIENVSLVLLTIIIKLF